MSMKLEGLPLDVSRNMTPEIREKLIAEAEEMLRELETQERENRIADNPSPSFGPVPHSA